MPLFGIEVPTYAAAAAIAATLAAVLGLRVAFSWKAHRFATESHPSIRTTLRLSYGCVYAALVSMAGYVLLGGRVPFAVMDRLVTLFFSAGSVSMTGVLLMVFGSGHEMTSRQAEDTFFLLGVPGLVGLCLMAFELTSFLFS